MEYFCDIINSKEAHISCVLPGKAKRNWRKLQNIGNENEISVTFPSPCYLFVNKHLHVDENKMVYALSENSLFIKSYWSVQYA